MSRAGTRTVLVDLVRLYEGKYDLGSEDKDGEQDSTVSVFTRDGDGTVRHTYSAHPRMADDIQERGIDLLTPVWHLLDLTPRGRGDWYPTIAY